MAVNFFIIIIIIIIIAIINKIVPLKLIASIELSGVMAFAKAIALLSPTAVPL